MPRSSCWLRGLLSVVVLAIVAGCSSPDDGKPFAYATIHEAARNGDISDVKRHLYRGSAVNAVCAEGLTPLQTATMHRHPELVEYLIAEGANVGVTDENGMTPLHWVCQFADSHIPIAQMLIASGANVNAQDEGGRTPLHACTRFSSVELATLIKQSNELAIPIDTWIMATRVAAHDIAESLLEHGANPNVVDRSGRAPLHYASSGGDINVIDRLIANGARVNLADQNGMIPLHAANSFETPWSLLMHIRVDEDGNRHESLHERPLERLLRADSTEVVRRLVELGGDVNALTKRGGTPLSMAALAGNADAIDVLLENGAVVGEQLDAALLSFSSILGDFNVAAKLIERGANVEARDVKHGHTPLIAAAVSRNRAIMKMLIEHGADVNAQDISGWTAIEVTARAGDLRLVEFLIENGADVNGEALLMAASRGHLDVAHVLIANGADVNARDKRNQATPLHWAAGGGHMDMVQLLVSHGADIAARDMQGVTPLGVARAEGERAVVQLIQQLDTELNDQTERHIPPRVPSSLVVVALMRAPDGGYAILGTRQWGAGSRNQRTVRVGDSVVHEGNSWEVSVVDIDARTVTLIEPVSGVTHQLIARAR